MQSKQKTTTKGLKRWLRGGVKDHIRGEEIIISKINVEALGISGIILKTKYQN